MNSPFGFCSRAAIKKAKQVLLIYSGGGYDGCIWEWNSCVLGKEEYEFWSLVTSGCNGIREWTLAKALLKDSLLGKNNTEVYFIDIMANSETWKKVDTVFSAHFLCNTMFGLTDTGLVTTAGLFCDCCNDFVEAADIGIRDGSDTWLHLTNLSGDGGIHMSYKTKVCDRCWSKGKCEVCDCYDDDEAWVGESNLTNGKCKDHDYLNVVEVLDKFASEYVSEYQELLTESCIRDRDWYELFRLDRRCGRNIGKELRELWDKYQDLGQDMFKTQGPAKELPGQLHFAGI
jgi:hypothetical protein